MSDHPLRTALLRGRRRPRRSGAGSPTRSRGDGYEFVEVREYVAGDDPRRIDWASTARSGGLQTRVILEDVALTFAAILDDSASMRVGRRVELRGSGADAVRAWYGAASTDDRCVRVDGRQAFSPVGLRGRRAAAACAEAATSSAFSLPDSLAIARAVLQRGAALLVVSDAYDVGDDDAALAQTGAYCDATLLLARDPWHDDLPLRGLTRVADAETGRSQLLYFGSRQRAAYVRAVARREAALLERFERAGWRTGLLDEGDGAGSLYAAFGLGFHAA